MPVISYNTAQQASAAVLYGSGAGQMIAQEESEIGSIGAVAVHREITKQLEMNGIKATVFRSAPYKALGLPYEKLSDMAAKEIQDDIDRSHDRFVTVLAENTGTAKATVSKWASGKSFEAAEAVKMGLLDSIQPIENVIANLNKRLENAPRKGLR
jgi:ClpP class serine protease